jgi:hypothetical protein
MQRGSKYQNPPGWEDVISGEASCVLRRYDEFSNAYRCQHDFRVIDSDGNEWDMWEFEHTFMDLEQELIDIEE